MNARLEWDATQVKASVSPEEWQTRVDLAACYRAVAMMGWDDLVFTHITAKIPGDGHNFLINPYGLMFEEITASSLVKIDLHGNKLDGNPHPINPAGFVIHSAVHAARENAQCVLHTHSLNGVAVSAQKGGVLPISQQSIFILASLAYHGYEGVALMDDEKPRLVADLGNKNFLMLRNHGLLTADVFLRGDLHDSGSCTGGWRRAFDGAAIDYRHGAGAGKAGDQGQGWHD
jgi:ribulose-5-phosphate 4-epimerase/fuculose-1-phosphate aldolase